VKDDPRFKGMTLLGFLRKSGLSAISHQELRGGVSEANGVDFLCSDVDVTTALYSCAYSNKEGLSLWRARLEMQKVIAPASSGGPRSISST
jgi:hypothetical protein